MIAPPLYVLCAFELGPLLRLLTGDKHIATETWQVAQVLLLWFYSSALTHSVSKLICMMTGHERRLMWLGLGEAAANLTLSITLVLLFQNVVSVAVGSLIPTVLFGWCLLWPWVARDVRLHPWQLFRETVLPSWIVCIPSALILGAPLLFPNLQIESIWLRILLMGGAGGLTSLLCVRCWSLTASERQMLRSRLSSSFRKNPADLQAA